MSGESIILILVPHQRQATVSMEYRESVFQDALTTFDNLNEDIRTDYDEPIDDGSDEALDNAVKILGHDMHSSSWTDATEAEIKNEILLVEKNRPHQWARIAAQLENFIYDDEDEDDDYEDEDEE